MLVSRGQIRWKRQEIKKYFPHCKDKENIHFKNKTVIYGKVTWRLRLSGIWRRVNWYIFADVSKEMTASIFGSSPLTALHSSMIFCKWTRRHMRDNWILRSAFFCDITQRLGVILYRRFGTTYRSHFMGQNCNNTPVRRHTVYIFESSSTLLSEPQSPDVKTRHTEMLWWMCIDPEEYTAMRRCLRVAHRAMRRCLRVAYTAMRRCLRVAYKASWQMVRWLLRSL
jgi:hypothetical protein